jgi:hypothetical protein
MPVRSVDEINITNFVDTGLTSPLSRYTFNVEIKYTDTNGVKRTYGPSSHTFPNDLTPMPGAVRRAFAEQMIKATIRVSLGIDDWSLYI